MIPPPPAMAPRRTVGRWLGIVALVVTAAAGGVLVGLALDDSDGRPSGAVDEPDVGVEGERDVGVDLDVMPWGRIDACPTHANPGSPPTSHCPTVGQMEIEILTLDPSAEPGLDIPNPQAWCDAFLEGGGFYCQPNGGNSFPIYYAEDADYPDVPPGE